MVTAKAPTYQTDSNPKANDLARSADQHPQVRYWSLCTTLKGRHTGDCLRDEQVAIPTGNDMFTAIVSRPAPSPATPTVYWQGRSRSRIRSPIATSFRAPVSSRSCSPGRTA